MLLVVLLSVVFFWFVTPLPLVSLYYSPFEQFYASSWCTRVLASDVGITFGADRLFMDRDSRKLNFFND